MLIPSTVSAIKGNGNSGNVINYGGNTINDNSSVHADNNSVLNVHGLHPCNESPLQCLLPRSDEYGPMLVSPQLRPDADSPGLGRDKPDPPEPFLSKSRQEPEKVEFELDREQQSKLAQQGREAEQAIATLKMLLSLAADETKLISPSSSPPPYRPRNCTGLGEKLPEAHDSITSLTYLIRNRASSRFLFHDDDSQCLATRMGFTQKSGKNDKRVHIFTSSASSRFDEHLLGMEHCSRPSEWGLFGCCSSQTRPLCCSGMGYQDETDPLSLYSYWSKFLLVGIHEYRGKWSGFDTASY
jgi:hypothetical protein